MKFVYSTAIALAACLAPVYAHPVESLKTCIEYSIPVTVTSENWIWSYPLFRSNYEVVNFITDSQARTAATDFKPFSGLQNQTASYTIGATLCTPKGYSKKTLLLATHGLNFDRSYWDLGINPEKYSFVDHFIARGYSVLFYDRLGNGVSTQ
jgi:hypothetical protein